MPYSPQDAKNNMDALIRGLEEKHRQLSRFIDTPTLRPGEVAQINNLLVRLDIEIVSRTEEAAFDAASATVIRRPNATEVSNFQRTLTELGRSISSMATFQQVTQFIQNVLTENRQRFIEIGQTIRKGTLDT